MGSEEIGDNIMAEKTALYNSKKPYRDPYDNMGEDAALIWVAWLFGFAWLIKTFMMAKTDNDIGQLIFALVTAGVTAGFLVGGFECVCNSGIEEIVSEVFTFNSPW